MEITDFANANRKLRQENIELRHENSQLHNQIEDLEKQVKRSNEQLSEEKESSAKLYNENIMLRNQLHQHQPQREYITVGVSFTAAKDEVSDNKLEDYVSNMLDDLRRECSSVAYPAFDLYINRSDSDVWKE